MRKIVLLGLAAGLLVGVAAPAAFAVTDDEVLKAIDKAKACLLGQQGADGAWPEQRQPGATADYGHTETVFYTLAYMDESPNRDYMDKALSTVMTRPLDYTYALAMRCMGYAHIRNKFLKSSQKYEMVDKAMKMDAMTLCQFQGSHGGWNYVSLNGSEGRFDFSNTQLAILALREAALAGAEIPDVVWKRAQTLYFKLQQQDGSWNYGDPGNTGIGADKPGYGSMTAAGLASIYITMDNLDLSSGCPCRGGVSNKAKGDFERRMDMALKWHEENFKPDANPKCPNGEGSWKYYWLYAVERVGIAAGYKYFGKRNWYKEGAEVLLKEQQGNGSWGGIPDTCFAALFLYKGRAPVLYNKLMFKGAKGEWGEWNMHRRDVANLTTYLEAKFEQMFHWQIVSLQAPVEEMHDAPILYITAESLPEFTAEDKQKLRAFTDTGGTILFEASCGNPNVRRWATEKFFKEIWPEWNLKPLGPEHGSFMDPHPLAKRPEVLGMDDGMRTFLFYSMDDISCPWQMRSVAAREYVFQWGRNLYNYSTDRSALRSKLAAREEPKTDRFTSPVKGGDKNTMRVARVKYGTGSAWMTNRCYKPFDKLAQALTQKASVTLKAEEEGVAPADLGDRDIAYLVGTGIGGTSASAPATPPAGAAAATGAASAASGVVLPNAQEREALKAYVAKGGFLWVEAAGGTGTFDAAFRKFAADAGWELKPIPPTGALMSGKLAKAVGYNLTSGVQFHRALRVARLGRAYAEFVGIYQGAKLVGLYNPFDVLFSTTGYDAYGCRGYQHEDALAVAMNVVLYLTDRPATE